MNYGKQFLIKPCDKVNLDKIDASFKDKHDHLLKSRGSNPWQN